MQSFSFQSGEDSHNKLISLTEKYEKKEKDIEIKIDILRMQSERVTGNNSPLYFLYFIAAVFSIMCFFSKFDAAFVTALVLILLFAVVYIPFEKARDCEVVRKRQQIYSEIIELKHELAAIRKEFEYERQKIEERLREKENL